jgi:predicted Fe-S protein YdhL (DUF1289 family)
MSAKNVLENIRVASPCSESWDAMAGTEQVRSCERCQHKVYNLSEMNAAEAADVIRKAEGRLCVRFYRRADGTILTNDCPVGVANKNKKYKRSLAVVTATAGLAAGAAHYASSLHKPVAIETPTPIIRPIEQPTMGEIAPPPPAHEEVMGKVAMPRATMGVMAAPTKEPVLLLIPTESHTETEAERAADRKAR